MAERSHPITIVYDYDDTLVGYKRFEPAGDWLDGAQESLRDWLGRGYAVSVASCRVNWGDGRHEIDEKLREAGFRPVFYTEADELQGGELGIYIGRGKPLGYAYVDDRGVAFGGDHETVNEILRETLPEPR